MILNEILFGDSDFAESHRKLLPHFNNMLLIWLIDRMDKKLKDELMDFFALWLQVMTGDVSGASEDIQGLLHSIAPPTQDSDAVKIFKAFTVRMHELMMGEKNNSND